MVCEVANWPIAYHPPTTTSNSFLTSTVDIPRLQRRPGRDQEGLPERKRGVDSCPGYGGDCECPSCLLSLSRDNKLIFFRKYSDPMAGREGAPR